MPSGLGGLVWPSRWTPGSVPEGHVAYPTGIPGRDPIWGPPGMPDTVLDQILADLRREFADPPSSWRPPHGLRAYFRGGQQYGDVLTGLEFGPVAPTADHFRVAFSAEDVEEALSEGEAPIYWDQPAAPSFADLVQAHSEQHAAPNSTPVFARDASGRYVRTGGGLSGLLGVGR